MSQRTFLGLTHNPFTPPRSGFFAGGDRKTHLEHLRHLSQWSRRILVVTGPFGIGKSSLFRELSGSLEPNTKAARLSGTVVTSEREALVGLLQGFGIAAEANAHADDLAKLILRHVDELDSLSRVCMVMVDDAHLLDVQAVKRLVSLVAKSGLRVLLFTEASLIPDLDRAVKNHELEWFEIRLAGFPRADVRDYLEWRFRQAQYRGLLPFTDEQLEKIVTRSAGNPSVIDSMANRLLADMESGEIRKERGGFPLMHATLAIMLAVLVGLVYLFAQEESPLEAPLVDASSELVQPTVSQVSAAEEPFTEPLNEALVASTDDLTEPGDPLTPIPETIASGLQENLLEEEVEDEAPMDPAPLEAPTDTTPLDESTVLEEPEEAEVGAASVNGEVARIEAPVAQAPVQETLIADKGIQDVPQRDVQKRNVSEQQSPAPQAVVPAPNPGAAASTAARFKNAAWILQQNPQRYTLQLLTLSSAERAAAFINRQSNPEEFAVYRMARGDTVLHVVTYGLFSGRAAAQSAADNFTGELARLKPWVRPMELVQQTVRATPQN